MLMIIVGLIIWGVRLEGKVVVNAQDMDDLVIREQVNKGQFYEWMETTNEIKETVLEISVNQKHIMRELGIEVN